MLALTHLHEPEAHERRRPEVEALAAIRGQVGLHPRPPLVVAQLAPVLVTHRDRRLPPHRLERALDAFPEEARPQDRVTRHDRLPRPPEAREVQLALQSAAHLRHVRALTRLVERVEEHPLLERSQRIEVLDTRRPEEPVELALAEPREREIRGRIAARLG